MNLQQNIFDKGAIAFSALCAFHCLALPVLLTLLPAIGALGLENEIFHKGMLMAVIPFSIIALFLGCRKHKQLNVAIIAGAGLLFLILAATIGHDFLGEAGEKGLTLVGACLLVIGHWRNYKLCREHIYLEPGCSCESQC